MPRSKHVISLTMEKKTEIENFKTMRSHGHFIDGTFY